MLNIKKKVAMALATTAMGAMLIGAGTFAIFTSKATNTDNNFTAGTLTLSATDPVFTAYDITNLAPGDGDSKTITVTNDGTLELKYDIDEALKGTLVTEQNDPDSGLPDPNILAVTIKDSSGHIIMPTIKDLSGNVIQQGEKRVLAPKGSAGDSEVLTVEYSLPREAGNAYQGDSATLGLTFNGEQTAHN